MDALPNTPTDDVQSLLERAQENARELGRLRTEVLLLHGAAVSTDPRWSAYLIQCAREIT